MDALRANSFGGAALDVTTEEPLPADSPLWELENVLITPHIAGLTEKMWERHYEHYTENLRRVPGRRSRCCGWWTRSEDISSGQRLAFSTQYSGQCGSFIDEQAHEC